MRWLPYSPRPLVQSVALLAIVVGITGCPGDPGVDEDDGSDDGFDQPQACEEPGSPLLDHAKPVELPGPDAQPFACGTGWATDAPQLNPTWTIELPSPATEFGDVAVRIDAHPDGGVVAVAPGLFARYDADGEPLWNMGDEVSTEADVAMVVEQAGTIVLSVFNWSDSSGSIDRYAADGSLIGAVPIPWNGGGDVWALETNGAELLIGAFDYDMEGSWETTLLRLDADDNVLLRKSTSMTNGGQLAVNDDGTAVFGSFPSFIVSLDSGAVLGQLTPSNGQPASVIGLGNDFVMVGNAAGDLSVGRYSEAGAEQWLQTYDRAALGDNGRAIDVGPDGSIVAVGTTSLLDFSLVWWFGTQPWVVGVDADGNAVWADRIGVVGDATDVAIGSGGEVYVSGGAEGIAEQPDGEPPLFNWLRRYDP